MKKPMTIGMKFMLSAGGLLVLLLGMSYGFLSSVGTLGSHLDEAANRTARKVELSGAIDQAATEMRGAVRLEILAAAYRDETELTKARRSYEKGAGAIEAALAEIRPMLVTDRGRRAAAAIADGLAAWRPLENEVGLLCASGKAEEANQTRKGRQSKVAEAMTAASHEILQINKELLAKAVAAGHAATVKSRWSAVLLLGLGLAIAAVVLLVVRSINSALRRISGEMLQGADQVASASSQVASSAQSLSQGSSEQAASLEETSASAEEINSMSRKNSENCRAVAELVVHSQENFDRTNSALGELVASMGEITSSSDRISKIIKVIEEIAFQTNILALNAAVEAARAGAAGMGFAVVADEVRNLAQRSSQAAKDTAALIEDSVVRSRDGAAKVNQVAASVLAVTEDAARIKTLVDDVRIGSEEQSRGIEQIANAVSQMEQVTQTAAAGAEESASASEELSAQSETVRSIVQRLSSMVGGTDERASSRQPARERRRSAQPVAVSARPGARVADTNPELEMSFR